MQNTTVHICVYLSTREKTSSSSPWTADSLLQPVKKISPQELPLLLAPAYQTPATWCWASTFLRPFSACHPPAGTSSSPTESRVSTNGADPGKDERLSFHQHEPRRGGTTKQAHREGSEAPFLVLLQRILSYPNSIQRTTFSQSCFLRQGSCFSKRHHIFWHCLHWCRIYRQSQHNSSATIFNF